MNETCGCCEGIEKITPVTIANRPGLSSLIYRVGSHASFLETMKARLSNLGLTLKDLGIVPDMVAGGDQTIYPLRRLTTRAAYDPAIALLDAWAIVADVLTFYQERIANEGYLRTATERRSILELARLVGYALRPGVSASVFLVYTLEVGAQTTITAGNRAQSLPGPGETPQPFETADKLVARAKWNNLQPRLTRPQFITQDNADVIDTIYFQGVSTALKPNDPLLLVFNENIDTAQVPPGQFVRFVQAVEPQAAESRTKVTLQDIVTVDTLGRAILQTIAEYLDLPAFCVSSNDPLVDEVAAISSSLSSDVLGFLNSSPQPDPKVVTQRLARALNGEPDIKQPGLQDILTDAVSKGDAHVANWLGGLVNDLEEVLRRAFLSGVKTGIVEVPPLSSLESKTRLFVPTLRAFRSFSLIPARVDGPPSSNGSNSSGIASRLPDLVASLSKPASLQPATSQRLDRSVSKAFGTQSDILPQLLTTLNPALKPTLYPAVSNAVVTPPSDLQSAQALRAKSAPFGNNAPLRPITNDKGIVVDHTEWPIADTETIEVDISTGMGSTGTLAITPQATISVTQGGQKLSKQVILDPNKPKMQVPLDGSSVDITIAVARLRFIHAIVNHQDPVDVYINGEKMNSSPIAYSKATDYFIVPPADNTLDVTVRPAQPSSAPPLLTREVTVDAGTSSTFIARENAFIQTTNDDISPTPTGQARIRLVNASSSTVLGAASADGTISLTLPQNSQYSDNQSVKADTYELTVTYGDIENQGTFKTSVTLDEQVIYDVVVLDTSDPANPLSSALLSHPPLIVTNELLRYTFSFPEQSRVFSVIAAGKPPLAINLIILQVDSFVGRFTQNQTQLISADGRNIILQVGDNIISLTDEAFAAVPVEERKIIALDAKFDQITPGSWVVIERPDRGQTIISRVTSVQQVSKADYGITGNVTQLTLDQPWLDGKDVSLATLRQVTVYAQSVERDLADEIIDPVKESVCGDQIELDDVYGGLQSGRWLIVAGERTDILGSTGVQGAELVMLAGVKQGVHQVRVPDSTSASGGKLIDLPGDTTHTFITLANALSYTYKRDTVTVYGNVVRATHGEMRNEVLGSGDGSKELQQFALRQSPLTYLSAPTPAGAVSTLKVFVNDIEWHETDNLAGLGSTDREFITQTDNNDKTTVIFGNGAKGARLPTGIENVKAMYRTGIGKPGNVNARQISLLATRPLGVKSVINPLPATGGADRESLDQARRNVPLAVLALDRLVSVQDYADFARTFAGIGKASAARLTDGRRQLVHLTIAGADNIPIDVNSDLYRNLFQSLRQFGDPNEPLLVALADVSLLVIQASVHLLPDYQIESVEPEIRTALLDAFSFEQRELGQPVFQSEVISVIQGVEGVDYVRLEIMGAVSQDTLVQALSKVAQNPSDPDRNMQGTGKEEPGEVEEPGETEEEELAEELLELLGLTDHNDVLVQLAKFDPTPDDPTHIAPAQLVFLSPDVPDTLILGEIPDERQA